MTFLAAWREPIYALTRIMVGLLFAQHGFQKIFGWFGGIPVEKTPLIWAAGFIELVGGGLVALGLFTSPAAFVCSGTMAVAYFLAHQPQGLLPIQNKGELAALYCWVFIFIASRGDGIWSLGGRRSG